MTLALIRNAVAVAIVTASVVGCSDDDEKVEEPLEAAAQEESETPAAESAAAEASFEQGSGTDTFPADTPVDPATAGAELAGGGAGGAGAEGLAGGAAPSDAGAYAYIMPASAAKFMWVFTDHLNVRAEPSQSAAKLGKLRWGKKVAVLAEQGDWVKISDGAWAARQHLTDRVARWHAKGSDKPAKQLAASSTATSLAPGRRYYRVAAEVLNVRDKPGKEGKIVGQLTHGSIVQGHKAEGAWVEIQPGQFVSGNWLSAGQGPVAH
jgi:uncharacterized protein YgiM (DUF1202 family)